MPGEFTRRAVDNGKLDLIAAEGLADLLSAETEAERRAAVLMSNGTLRAQIEHWREAFVLAAAELTRAIDLVGEDEETDGAVLPKSLSAILTDMKRLLDRPRAERIRQGFRVVLAGPPNAGKSSLFNRLLEDERAIVSEVAGTTRDHLEAQIRFGSVPISLIDTAGIRESEDPIEREGVRRSTDQIKKADLILWLGRPEDQPLSGDVLLVRSKCDLTFEGSGSCGLPVSARTGEGVSELANLIHSASQAYMPKEPELVLNDRQARCLRAAHEAGSQALTAPAVEIISDGLLRALGEFDKLTGRVGFDDLSAEIYSRFCLGK